MRAGEPPGRRLSRVSSRPLPIAACFSSNSRPVTPNSTTPTVLGEFVAPYRRNYDPLGARTGWTHIVPGFFGPSGFSGLLLYNQAAGLGRFYDIDGAGSFVLRSDYSDWKTSWTHIVAGRFTSSSPYSSVFFYSASENYGEIWATDGIGLAGHTPLQTFENVWDSPFTHVLAGDFHWTPGYIYTEPILTDLFLFDGINHRGEMYRCDDSGIVLTPSASSDSLPLQPTCVVPGNFGGFGNTDLAFYDGPTGTLQFYSFQDNEDEVSAKIVLRETQSGLRTTANILVAGNFWMSNPEDHWFNDGPPSSSTPPYDPDWRFGTGPYTDFLFYDANAGLGEFYFHEPLPYPVAPLEGYITSQTKSGDAWVSTGSVVPGESISFHVSSQLGPYSITIYQTGIFDGGSTEQMMTVIDGLPADPMSFPIGRTAYKLGAQWPAVASFVVPSWPSGLYLARVQTTGASAVTFDLPFVVRAPSGAQAGTLLVLADCTYAAYNAWGGRSFYGNYYQGAYPSAAAFRVPFGFELSFERPLNGAPDNDNSPQGLELPFIQWLAAKGFPFDVCTSRDLHFAGPSPNDYRLIVFVGHHEYWTADMRTNVETFAKQGGNVAFFAGNTCWWQVRLAPDGRQVTCYKVAGFDPVSTTPSHALTTVHWFDDLVKRPETALTGVSWNGGAIVTDWKHRYTVKRADHWVFAGTGLFNGAKFGSYPVGGARRHSGIMASAFLQSAAAGETDPVQVNGPNGLNSPPDYTLASIYDLANPDSEVGTMGIFQPSSASGWVFNGAAEYWTRGLNHTGEGSTAIDQITFNVISRLGPWTSVSQGSSTPGARVSAVLTGPNQISLFIADAGGGIYTVSGDTSGNWGPWTSVSQGSSTPGAPVAAVLTGPNRISLFIADAGGGIYTVSGDTSGNWGPWTSVSQGSSTPGAPVAAVLTGPNQISLFIADAGGGIYTVSGDINGNWGPWTSVSQGSSTPGAPVTAVLTGPNQISLFVADAGGGIYTVSGDTNGNWGAWTSVSQGSSTPGAPVTAVLTGPNQISLFIADAGGGIYTVSGDTNGNWGPWTSVSQGSSTPGAPVAAVLTGPNQIRLFVTDVAGDIYAASRDTNGDWGPWTRIPGRRSIPGAPVAAVLIAPNNATLFVADVAGAIYTTNK